MAKGPADRVGALIFVCETVEEVPETLMHSTPYSCLFQRVCNFLGV